jgi:hypothetical protein
VFRSGTSSNERFDRSKEATVCDLLILFVAITFRFFKNIIQRPTIETSITNEALLSVPGYRYR